MTWTLHHHPMGQELGRHYDHQSLSLVLVDATTTAPAHARVGGPVGGVALMDADRLRIEADRLRTMADLIDAAPPPPGQQSLL